MEPQERISHLQEKLRERQLGGALLFYSRDIFYYTGTAQPSYLIVLPEDYCLFVKSGHAFALGDVFIEKEKVKEERRLENIYREIAPGLEAKKIATELDILPAMQFQKFQKTFAGYDFMDISPLILEQRKTKDALEIEKLKHACEVLHQGHEALLSCLHEGMTELELAAAIENAHRLAGHEGIFFMRQPDFFMSRGPISSGPNISRFSGVVYSVTGVGLSPAVPAGPSCSRISKGDVVVVDIPTMVEGYHADQTRTYVLGKADMQMKELHDSLKEIADHLIINIRPGAKCSEIFQMAMDQAGELNVIDAFLNFGGGKRGHMIGHGIGLELSEPPIISKNEHSEIKENYVIALELHMFREHVGVVKLEDMILLKRNGNELLTKSPRRLLEIPC